jgi:hypothetical protein
MFAVQLLLLASAVAEVQIQAPPHLLCEGNLCTDEERKLFMEKAQESALSFWKTLKSGWSKVSKPMSAFFENTHEALVNLATSAKDSWNALRGGVMQMYDNVTGSWVDMKEGFEDCQPVNGSRPWLKCAERIADNVKDLIWCNNITYELSFAIPCTDVDSDMKTRKDSIVNEFKKRYADFGVTEASIIQLETCGAEPAKEAEIPATVDNSEVPARILDSEKQKSSVQVQVELDISTENLTEDQILQKTKAFKEQFLKDFANFEGDVTTDEAPESFTEVPAWLPNCQGPVVWSEELDVCEMYAQAKSEMENIKKATDILRQNATKLKTAAESEKEKMKTWWGLFKSWFHIGSDSDAKIKDKEAEIEEADMKQAEIMHSVDHEIQVNKKRMHNNEKVAPGFLKEVTQAQSARILMPADGNIVSIQDESRVLV